MKQVRTTLEHLWIAAFCVFSGCVQYHAPVDVETIHYQIAWRYVHTGSIPSPREGIVCGLVRRGVKAEWFESLGGHVDGDPSLPGAEYITSSGGRIEYECDEREPSYYLTFHSSTGKTVDVDWLHPAVDGGPALTLVRTTNDLPYLYLDESGRISINTIAQKGRVPLNPRTGKMR